MLEWVLAGLLCVVTYVVFTLSTSSGSQFEDNSIDAFISKGVLLLLRFIMNFIKLKKSYLDPHKSKVRNKMNSGLHHFIHIVNKVFGFLKLYQGREYVIRKYGCFLQEAY